MPGSLAIKCLRFFWAGIDWIYPPICAGCGKQGVQWCSTCQQAVIRLMPPFCPICGNPQVTTRTCKSCQDSPPHFIQLRSWALYQGTVRQAIQGLKYRRNLALGEVFSRRLINLIQILKWEVDTVMPVPLGIARMAERGYNQAALLALPLAWGLGLSYIPGALRRVRETRSQVDLPATERKLNVAKAFQAAPEKVKNRQILIVDDVATTGATLDACGEALLDAGAQAVYALTLARTPQGVRN